MRSKRVSTIIDGKKEVHMVGGASDYDTACGIDMNDETLGHFPHNIAESVDRIDCAACVRIWRDARGYRPNAFKGDGK